MLIIFATILFLPHLLPSIAHFDCPFSSFDMSKFYCVVYSSLGLLWVSIALGFKGNVLMVLNPTLMFCLDSN